MNFEFNDEQKALQQLARRVAKDKVAQDLPLEAASMLFCGLGARAVLLI